MLAVNEADRVARRELARLDRELARRDQLASIRATFGHDAKQLTNNWRADAEGLPMLALHQGLLAVLRHHQDHCHRARSR